MVKKDGLPSFWITHIAKALVGDTVCLLQPYLLGHYKVEKRPNSFDSATWRANHTELLNLTLDRLTTQGWTSKVEGANFFRVVGTAAIVSGKPDAVARKGAAIKVIDTKTGAPSESHVAQVALYCLLLPIAWNRPDLQINGEVVYATHTVPVFWERAQELKGKAFGMIKRLASEDRPVASPSESSCRFCDISKTDCPDRVDEAAPDIHTSEW